MKSFQSWMDCQRYTSHLTNLQRIKKGALEVKIRANNRKIFSTSHSAICKSFDSAVLRQEIKSKITHSKSELQQSRIEKQNYHLANRIINVPAVISKDKQLESYRKYRSLFNRRPSSKVHDLIRDEKLKKFFITNSRNFTSRMHKSILRITIFSVPKVPEGKLKTFWLDVVVGSQKVSSKHMDWERFLFEEIIIPLKSADGTKFLISLHCSRGLDYLNLGQYQLELNKFNIKKDYSCISAADDRKRVELSIMREKVFKQNDRKLNNFR